MADFTLPGERERLEAQPSDEVLMARLARRDTRALEALYDRHARSLYSLAVRLLGDGAEAEEVVQECFLKLWRSPDLYHPQRGRPLAWLMGMTHHRAVDTLRRRRAERRALEVASNGLDSATPVEDGPEHQAWRHQERESIRRALLGLPPAQRQVLELAYFEGLTQSEIAHHLGEPLGTIKTRVRLAMQKLRESAEYRGGRV